MDVRRATWYYKWKAGVELLLYEFQLSQSSQRRSIPCAQQVTVASDTPLATHNQVPECQWEELDFLMGSRDNPIEQECTPVAHRPVVPQLVVTPANDIMRPSSTQEPHVVMPTPAALFMQERPAGPVHATKQSMKALERSITVQAQRKSNTATVGCHAFHDISSQTKKGNTARDIARKSNKKTKESCKRPATNHNTQKRNKQRMTTATKRKASTPVVAAVTITHNDLPVCTYGCTHDGLVGLKQMMPYDTKFCLQPGNYFHNKVCLDCKTFLADVFGASKNRALVYYCPMDYNVHNLRDDNAAVAESPCACILCINCYFRREQKKTAASGKGTRASGRGRKN